MIIIVRGQHVGNSKPACTGAGLRGAASAVGAVLCLCVGLVATDAAAASTHHKRTPAAHAISGRAVGYAGSPHPFASGLVPVGAIGEESCDLPTSGCSNDLRISN